MSPNRALAAIRCLNRCRNIDQRDCYGNPPLPHGLRIRASADEAGLRLYRDLCFGGDDEDAGLGNYAVFCSAIPQDGFLCGADVDRLHFHSESQRRDCHADGAAGATENQASLTSVYHEYQPGTMMGILFFFIFYLPFIR